MANESNGIPPLLQRLPRWIRWQTATPPGGKPTKRPIGSVRGRLLSYEEAVRDWRIDADHGVGLAFTGGVKITSGETLFAFDLDACVHPATREVMPWAEEVLRAHDRSYTEVTPSGSGLRQWVAVRNPPAALRRTKVDVPHPAPPGVEKRPNLQVFGLPHAQYVTVTGQHLRGTRDQIRVVDDLDWLVDRFQLGKADESFGELPVGEGPVPTLAEIDQQLRRLPLCAELIRGQWEKPGREGSASEAYYVLVQHVLRAARGHGAAAVAYLLERTAWGKGLIENSKDANRYTRQDWVRAEVGRISGKRAPLPAAQVFDDGAVFAHEFVTPGELAARVDPTGAADTVGKLLTEPPAVDDLLFPNVAEFLRGEEDNEFLVFNLLPREGLAQFYGDPSSGKTPFLLSLAVHVAGGLPSWFGHKVDRHGTVVYMVGEGRQGLRKRLRAEMQLHGLQPPQVDIRATKRPGRLTDAEDVAAWAVAIRAAAPDGVALIVVDTQNANFGAGNENATEDMTRFVQNLKALSARFECLIAMSHHKGHGDKERGRGNTALWGALDADFDVTRKELCVQAAPRKCKDWEAQDPLVGTLLVSEVRKDADGRPVTAVCLKEGPPSAEEVFSAGAFDGDDLMRSTFTLVAALARQEAPAPVTARRLAELLDTTEKAVRSRLRRLADLGAIESIGETNSKLGMTYRLPAGGEALAALPELESEVTRWELGL